MECWHDGEAIACDDNGVAVFDGLAQDEEPGRAAARTYEENAANFQNLTVLADFQASLERAAEVLERTDGFRQIALD